VNPLVELRNEPDRIVVVLRPFPWWRNVAVMVLITIVAAALVFVLRRVPDSVLVNAILGVAIAAMLGSTYGAVLAAAWYTIGREVVTATHDGITIDHHIVGRRRRRTFAATSITGLRAVGAQQVMRGGRPVHGVSALSFDYEGQTVRFGAGLAGPDADRVVLAVTEAVTRASSRASR
jgi:hypothetical protein